MVRMLDIRSICFSRLCDDGFRLTHPRRPGAKLRVNSPGRVCEGRSAGSVRTQPALAASQAIGSISPPLTHTSKWRWLAVERPVLPTKPISCPAATVSPAWT